MKINLWRTLAIISVAFMVKVSPVHALDPTRILIVYNADYSDDQDMDGVQDSSEVAHYYATSRGVPSANILGVHIGFGTEYTTENFADQLTFYNDLVVPINNYLVSVGSESIDTILLVYGIPYYIANYLSVDNAITELPQLSSTTTPTYYVALNSVGGYSAGGCTFEPDRPNFTHSTTKMEDPNVGTFIYDMYLVARLDGPNGVFGAMGLVDQARWSDVYTSTQPGGYSGNLYVNTNNPYGLSYLQSIYAVQNGLYDGYVDQNLAMQPYYAENNSFFNFNSNLWNFSGSLIPTTTTYANGVPSSSAPNCFIYGGWYRQFPSSFTFVTGAIYVDFNSFSLQGFRESQYTPGSTQVAALADGVTAVAGTINEPYQNGHPRPNVITYYILKGYSWAEASNLSTQQTGWMQVNIGDPMYAPLQTKTFLQDTSSPTLAAGYPIVQYNSSSQVTIIVAASDTVRPEVMSDTINYGLTTGYGSSVNTGLPYWRIQPMVIGGLSMNTTYHFDVVMKDPVGNTTTTQDFTFNLGNPPPNSSSIGNSIFYNGTIH